MYRTENMESRLDILNLLLVKEYKFWYFLFCSGLKQNKTKTIFTLFKKTATSEISLKLFMDYHGIQLIWIWMIDITDLNDSIPDLECKIKVYLKPKNNDKIKK